VTEFKPGQDAEGEGQPSPAAQELARTTACQEAHPPVSSQLNPPASGAFFPGYCGRNLGGVRVGPSVAARLGQFPQDG
jgi:hypothetical protein